jgi:hypothetical protein
MSRFAILFIRYAAAIVVSCIVSFAVFGIIVFIAGIAGSCGPDACEYAYYVGNAVVGFCGVLIGAFCLERTSQRVGSIFLLFLGLAFYIFLCYPLSLSMGSDAKAPLYLFSFLLPLAIGGLLAVARIFLVTRRPPPSPAP